MYPFNSLLLVLYLMHYTKKQLQTLLDEQYNIKDKYSQINEESLDPLIVAREYKDEFVALVCALFAYGNVRAIVKFLNSIDFGLLDGGSDDDIKQTFSKSCYRFQNSSDISAFLIALKNIKNTYRHLGSNRALRHIFYEGYKTNNNVLCGIDAIISKIKQAYKYDSNGYKFLIGKNLKYTKDKNTNKIIKTKAVGAYKRWNLFLRWMVREDNIDMGLWVDDKKPIYTKDLLIPLDTHLFSVSKQLGLIKRNTADLECAIELSRVLGEFDSTDPIKYDFAIYRLGQESKNI